MNSVAEKEMEGYVAEFLLRQLNPMVSGKKLLYIIGIGNQNNPRIMKTVILRCIWSEIATGVLTEDILDMLEIMEVLLVADNCVILPSLKSAYCAVAVECTARCMLVVDRKKRKCLDAIRRIWMERIEDLRERRSQLVTEELNKWKDDLNAAIKDKNLRKMISEKNTRLAAVVSLQEFVSEHMVLLGAPFLETAWRKIVRVKKRKEKKGVCRPGGDDDHTGNMEIEDKETKEKSADDVVSLDDHTADVEMENLQTNDKPAGNENTAVQSTGGGEVCPMESDENMNGMGNDRVGSKDKLAKDGNTAVREALKSSLLEMFGVLNNMDNKKQNVSSPSTDGSCELPHNALIPSSDKAPQPIGPENVDLGSQGQSLQNNIPENLDDAALGSEGTSSSGVRPHLPTPRSLNVSPLVQVPQRKRAAPGGMKHGWTTEEERALIEGIGLYGKEWAIIKQAYPVVLAQRSNVDLKDKWRNLTKQK